MPHPLPQLEKLFLTDGGLETDLLFNHGIELPGFSAIMLLRTDQGRAALDSYFRGYLEFSRRIGLGFVLESASWRAGADWAPQLGVTPAELDRLSARSVEMLKALRREYETPATPVVVSGCIGPRGDGYDPGRIMSRQEAEDYHLRQAAALAAAGPDLLTAMTLTNVNEAIGIARAAEKVGLPVVISFTVETDGRLPTGDRLGAAIQTVDQASAGYPAYFMINCAHPSHFEEALAKGGSWTRRIRGLRANASKCSHAELDAMTDLDAGNPSELGEDYRRLLGLMPHLTVLGGCCGTDQRHIEAIAEACLELA
ncbi:homocysteine S-methyltransferase family protein [Sphingosinicella sp. CPCC 101087]|uniref:homocysteine S-methyltransferase family protein n=1 Tax=Sphingosinicella sp. CPCC 101087 TaxID=2497754 RepID=UPI00101CCF92|nr:homocysteine S-methyltransferase family protein [Sphingosinicella sp. CPCC 101087]